VVYSKNAEATKVSGIFIKPLVSAKGSFLGRRELSLCAASEQFPIYGADNGVAAACIAAKSL
jgi:hypothetical protein